MAFNNIKGFLNRDVSDVFGRRASEEVPESAAVQDAQLEIVPSGERLELHCTSPRLRFFSIQAKLAGALSITRATSADRVPTLRIGIPVRDGARTHTLDVIYYGEIPSQGHPLRRSSLVPSSHGRQVEFVFGEDRDRALYRFTISDSLQLEDFQTFERDLQQPAGGPPSVAQLAAVLRATLRQRRDTIAILEDLSQPLSISTVAMVGDLRDRIPPRHGFPSLPVQWLQEHLRQRGQQANVFRLTALCMLLDMEAGKITGQDIDALVEGRSALVPSWEAVSHVARFEGEPLDMRTWKERYEAEGLPFPARAESAVFEKMTLALALIEDRMHERDTSAVLANLVRESPSARAEAVARRWAAEAERGFSATPTAASFQGFDPFYRFLNAAGVRMDPNTLKAFCLYAEIEASRLTEERFVQWLQGFVTLNLSPYSMHAVAAALDVELLALELSSDLRPLLAMSGQGLLQGIELDGASEPVYRFIETGDEPLERGWRPSRGVLMRVPVLDPVSPGDLQLFLSLGHAFYGCFQSDLDRRRLWKRVAEGDAQGTFLEGFRVYHFQGRILAELDVQGSPGGPDIYLDNRGSMHYFAPGQGPAPGAPMEKQAVQVRFVSASGVPELLPELPLEHLLGTVEQTTGELNRLDRVGEALRAVMASGEEMGPALASRGMRAIAQNVESPRLMQILRPVVDGRTLDYIRQTFLDAEKSPVECHIFEPVLQGLRHAEILDFACLALVYELCASDVTSAVGFHKSFNRHWFRAALRNQLLTVLESENPQVQRLGCKLLSTSSCVGDATERPIVEYELQKHLQSADPEVAQEAATSLVRLALEPKLALPALWQFRRPDAAAAKQQSQGSAPVVEVMQEIREWHAALQALMGAPSSKAGASGTPPALLEMGRLIAGARFAFNQEAVSGGAVDDYLVAVADEMALKALMESFVKAWRGYADASHRSLRDVIAQVSAPDGLDDFLAFARGSAEHSALWWPSYDAGVTVPMWPYADISGLWISRGTAGGRTAVSPFFLAVLHRVMEDGEDAARLLRMRAPRSTEDTPAALGIEVFNTRTGAFEGFLHQMRIPSQFFLDVQEQELVSALVARLAPAAPAAAGAAPPRVGKAAPVGAESAPRDARLLAARLLEVFQMPSSLLPQAVYVLKDACHATGRALW